MNDRPKIVSVVPLPDYCVQIEYSDGVSGTVNILPLIKGGGVFTPMADPAVLAQVRIGEIGRSIEWPGEVDLCADALRMKIDAAAFEHATAAL